MLAVDSFICFVCLKTENKYHTDLVSLFRKHIWYISDCTLQCFDLGTLRREPLTWKGAIRSPLRTEKYYLTSWDWAVQSLDQANFLGWYLFESMSMYKKMRSSFRWKCLPNRKIWGCLTFWAYLLWCFSRLRTWIVKCL